MKKNDKTSAGTDRRGFLKLAGAGVAGSGAAIASAVVPAEAASKPADTNGGGYRETDHVRRYYELAKFI